MADYSAKSSSSILIRVLIRVLNCIYWLIKKKTEVEPNKILFLSRQSDKPSLDYRMLFDEIQRQNPDAQIVAITSRIEKRNLEVFRREARIIWKQMYHLATSKVCVVDGYNIPVSVLKKREGQHIIQIWHSLGAIKKFGHQSTHTKAQKRQAQVLRMHKNYDSIICASQNWIPYFAKAFKCTTDKLKVIGLPRIDYLLTKQKQNRAKIYRAHNDLRRKKVILYAPTFRNGADDTAKINELLSQFDHKKYTVILKAHPNMKYKNNHIYRCDDFSTLQLLSIADYVITDYSALILEAMIAGRPVMLYAYDYDKYYKDPGLNINLKNELKPYFFTDAKKLASAISHKKYSDEVEKQFLEKFIQTLHTDNTKQLTQYILSKLAEEEA